MFIVKYRHVFFLISGLLVLASWVALGYFGLNLGTDFRGGSILELEYSPSRPQLSAIQGSLTGLDLGGVAVQSSGDQSVILRLRTITDAEKKAILARLSFDGKFGLLEKRFSSVGPALGSELANKAIIAIVIVVVLIILYIAFAFRSVSHASILGRGPSSWKYGLIAVLTLIHDISIPAGVFAILGHYRGVEIDALFLTALLTILGLSVNDTIGIFDRIRENLKHKIGIDFTETAGISLSQTFARSLITSLTVIIVLLAILIYGSESTRYFSLAMTIGMFVGTYSSLFVAAPLLVAWQGYKSQ